MRKGTDMKNVLGVFRKGQWDNRTVSQRLYDAFLTLVIGKKQVVFNTSLSLAQPLELNRRALIVGNHLSEGNRD
jgi:hypothetical protein